MNRPTILVVHPRPTRGGFTSVVLQARELRERGDVDVVVVCEDGQRLAELPDGVEIWRLPAPMASVGGIRSLRRAFRTYRPDLVHFHGRQAGVLGRILMPRRLRGRVIYTPHGTPWSGSSHWRWLVGELLERFLLPRTSAVLCVSYAELSDWTRRGAHEISRVLHNPIPVSAVLSKQSALRPTVLVPSGYDPQKRLEVVIEGLALAHSDIQIEICGWVDDPEYRGSIEQLARQWGVGDRVLFRGPIGDVSGALACASLVILPSYSEGMPIVGVEAILAGARVAWSRIPPHMELFAEAGAPFWTASELAGILDADHAGASTIGRRQAVIELSSRIEIERREFWDSFLSYRASSDQEATR